MMSRRRAAIQMRSRSVGHQIVPCTKKYSLGSSRPGTRGSWMLA